MNYDIFRWFDTDSLFGFLEHLLSPEIFTCEISAAYIQCMLILTNI